jgi:hypothetical protein
MAKAKETNPQAPSTDHHYAEIRHCVYISTNIGTGCEHCDYAIGALARGTDDLASSINHYIEQHAYRLLHVGTETSYDDHGKPWHSTVAVLGSTSPPPQRPIPGKIKIIEKVQGE